MNDNLNLGSNTEIEKALKEFEIKSQAEQTQKALEALKTSDVPKMVEWVMKISGGTIKEQRQAEYVLLGFAFLAIAFSVFLFSSGTEKTLPEIPPGYETVYKENEPPRLEKIVK